MIHMLSSPLDVRIFTNTLLWMNFQMTSTNRPLSQNFVEFFRRGIQKDMVPNGCQNAKMPTHLERKKDAHTGDGR